MRGTLSGSSSKASIRPANATTPLANSGCQDTDLLKSRCKADSMWLFGKRNRQASAKAETQPRIPTVKFDESQVAASVEADIRSTLRHFPEIGTDELQPVYDAALQSVRAGHALNILYDALIRVGLDKHRAAEIARLVNSRATTLMQRERQVKLGITEAVWMYSGAPCMLRPKVPSAADRKRDAEHSAANGKRFVVAMGMLMNGRRVWPGQEPGCKCVSKPIIPGLE